MPVSRPAEERFLEKIEIAPTGCWIWTAATNRHGYGMFNPGRSTGRRWRAAHIWAYEHFIGTVPDGLELDHLCRNPRCANPNHLEPVSHAVNIRRGITVQRNRERFAAQTHCKNGHPFSGENLLMSGGIRICRTCKRAAGARTRQRRRQAA